jgi:hypothetical protein
MNYSIRFTKCRFTKCARRFTKCARVPGIAFVALVLSMGKPNVAHAEHAVLPSESAIAAALDCFETWLDRPADFIAAVECMYRAWQIAAFRDEALRDRSNQISGSSESRLVESAGAAYPVSRA